MGISEFFDSMYILNMQIRVINILLLVFIWYSYIKNKKIVFQRGRYFTACLGIVSANIVFDIVAVYGLFYKDRIPYNVNRTLQLFYLETLIISMYAIYMHILSLCGQAQYCKKSRNIVRTLPLVVSMLVLPAMPVHFYKGYDGVYSFGAMNRLAFMVVGLYLVMAAVDVLMYRKKLKREYFHNIAIGIITWAGFVIVQLYVPRILLTGTGMALMMLANYLNFEDPKLYINNDNGCFNNMAYRRMLKKLFAESESFCVCNIGFHEFNIVHGRYGHDVCQEIITNIANIIGNHFGTQVYSVEEETLGILLKGNITSYEDIDLCLNMIDYDYVVNENIIHVTGFIELVRCPEDADDITELEDILDFMKKSANRDKNFYMADREFLKEKRKYSKIVQMLEYAINNDGFEMLYQPIYSTEYDEFHSAEALIRLKDTETIWFVSPEYFIPIAEKEGMIMQIGEIVLSKVCRFAREAKLIERGVKYLEVNLSGIQCIDQGMPDQINRIVEEYNLPCDFLNLEITETAAVESGDLLNRNMMRLKSMGTTFSMDDFGTGYSNLAQMADTPYELIKIDKSLIWYCYPVQRRLIKENEEERLTQEFVDKSKAVLIKVIELINDLNLKIVAEGVETKEMVNMLTELGVHYLQGYYFSRPLNEKKYIEFLENNA